MKQYDVIIIGAGIAGMTAGIYLARAGRSVLILEGKIRGGQIVNTLTIENWPGDLNISGKDLTDKIYHQMHNLGAEISYEQVTRVERLLGKNNEFKITADDHEYTCRAIIIATGTEPRKLSSQQSADAGARAISYCATCDGALYKGKPVVVVGSGNTAKNEIKYLEGLASKVYHIHHDDPIPEEAEAVFVAIGRVPATQIFSDLVALDTDGYIVAGEDCATSCPGVYVAGDVRTKSVRQLVTAASDGAISATEAIKYLS